MKKPLNICLGGYIVGGPLGGLVWHHLQYVLGLHQMGHNVLFVEDSDGYPSCYNPLIHQFSDDPTYGLAFIRKVFGAYDLKDKWAYRHQTSNKWFGRSEHEVKEFARRADVFINLSGINPMPDVFANIPVRVYLDTDPVFTQVRNIEDGWARERTSRHTHFFTFAENVGNNDCSIPSDGFNWQPTRQPVVLNAWKTTAGNQTASWTTVMQWDSYKVRQHNGIDFGMKSASFDPFLQFPAKVSDTLELAIGSANAPKAMLQEAGWHIKDPMEVSLTPELFQQYIMQSKGEWSVAKQGYVCSRSGWFSERSTGYLASGRPVVVQDTGFSRFFNTGKGLLCFTNPEEAKEALLKVDKDYDQHCASARAIAETYFAADKVLTSLLDRL